MSRLTTGWLLVAAGLGGCGLFGGGGEISETCDEPQPYQSARLGKPVESPEGLDQLDVLREMPIPKAESQPQPPGSGCITSPPSIQSE